MKYEVVVAILLLLISATVVPHIINGAPVACNTSQFKTKEPWATAKRCLLADMAANTYSKPGLQYWTSHASDNVTLYGYASCAAWMVCGRDGYCPTGSDQCFACLTSANYLLSQGCKYNIGAHVWVNADDGLQCYMRYEKTKFW